MCGIAGEVRAEAGADTAGVRAMVDRLRHRGPDHAAVWRSPDGACALGHARLSIVDLSEAGHQPMLEPATGNALVFNGEIYNHRELRAECEARGERFRSGSDTEVVLALYRQVGARCVERLRGMFAFALWDAARGELFLARDRVGKKPLFYAHGPGGFRFASELDPLARHPDVSREIDPAALELYLQLQYVPAPWSIYGAVRKLPPGHVAVVRGGALEVRRYWDLRFEPKVEIGEEEALDALDARLREAVRLRFLSADVPVGALLSGGVDSSLVVALAVREGAEGLHTFSVGFDDEAFSELPYARRVAELYGTRHHAEVVHGEVAPLLEELVVRYGEPFADSSAIPSFLVARSARREVKAVLTGDGGDELLGGYPRHALSAAGLGAARALGASRSADSLARLMESLPTGGASLAARVRRRWTLRAAHPELQSLFMYATFWNDDQRGALLGGRPGAGALPAWRRRWLEAAREVARHPVDRMLWIDLHTYLPGDLLAKMDIATMACGLEARAPLLDPELMEFCATLPVRYKVRRGTGKYLLKRLAERYLPRDLLYRRKMGFAIPKERWLRGPLRPLLREVVSDRASLAPLRPEAAAALLAEFEGGRGEHRDRLWAVLMFGLWNRACGPAARG